MIDVDLILVVNALAVEVVLHGDWQAHAKQLRSMRDYGPEYVAAAERLERTAERLAPAEPAADVVLQERAA